MLMAGGCHLIATPPPLPTSFADLFDATSSKTRIVTHGDKKTVEHWRMTKLCGANIGRTGDHRRRASVKGDGAYSAVGEDLRLNVAVGHCESVDLLTIGQLAINTLAHSHDAVGKERERRKKGGGKERGKIERKEREVN